MSLCTLGLVIAFVASIANAQRSFQFDVASANQIQKTLQVTTKPWARPFHFSDIRSALKTRKKPLRLENSPL